MGFNVTAIKKGIAKAKTVATMPLPLPLPKVPSFSPAAKETPDESQIAMERILARADAIKIKIRCERQGPTWTWHYGGGHLGDLALTALLRRLGARDAASGRTIEQEAVKQGNTRAKIGKLLIDLRRDDEAKPGLKAPRT